MSQAQLEKKVADYLRKSQALEDYWQRPITAEQLQAEMDRMAKHTRQPEVLRELFEALGNDPFVIAECLARPALAERLLTNWYAYDERIHGELKQRAEAELQTHPAVEQMKQFSGMYTEIELLQNGSSQDKSDPESVHSLNLNSLEWRHQIEKMGAMFDDHAVATGVSPLKGAPTTHIKTGVISPLQEDQTRYYLTAVLRKTNDKVKLATVSWLKESLESWLAKAETQISNAVAAPSVSYTLPRVSEGADCIDDTWTPTSWST